MEKLCESKGYKIVKPLDDGESSVKKLLIEKSDKKFILRLYDIRFMNHRYNAFSNVRLLNEKGVNVPKLYDYGDLKDGVHGYAIFEWIDGESLDRLIDSNQKANRYGIKTADQLLEMHGISITQDVDITQSFYKCIYKRIEKLKNMNVDIDYDRLIDYISKNIHELYNQSTNIIHGDLHPGNIIINNDKSYLIDLDVCQKGFSWEDLCSNSCNMLYPDFYTILINEYFKGNIPLSFWKVYNLYGIYYCLDYIIYSSRTDGKTIEDGIKRFYEFLDFTNNLENCEPKWFNHKILEREK